MPVYEFSCKKCEILVEEVHPMKDAPSEAECPECGETIKRHYGSMNFVLKGEGWPGKNIKAGKPATDTRESKGLAAAKKLEDVMEARQKAGMDPKGKETNISEKEVKRQKENISRWIDEGSKGY